MCCLVCSCSLHPMPPHTTCPPEGYLVDLVLQVSLSQRPGSLLNLPGQDWLSILRDHPPSPLEQPAPWSHVTGIRRAWALGRPHPVAITQGDLPREAPPPYPYPDSQPDLFPQHLPQPCDDIQWLDPSPFEAGHPPDGDPHPIVRHPVAPQTCHRLVPYPRAPLLAPRSWGPSQGQPPAAPHPSNQLPPGPPSYQQQYRVVGSLGPFRGRYFPQ